MRDFAEPLVEKIPWIDTFNLKPSKDFFGTQAVLRVSFGNFLFFSFFSLVMIGVKDQKDPRDGWHHGGWMLKFIFWFLLIAFAFFLPNEVFPIYGGIARFGSGFFLLIQMVILLDFTYNWNSAWVAKDDHKWYMGLLAVSIACFVGIIIGTVLMFHWFTPSGHDCQKNVFFITFTLLLVVGFTTISLHPEINGSLLPSSVIGVYCTYLCWSALSSEPRTYECNGLAENLNAVSNGTLVVGFTTTLLSVVYSAVKAGSSTALLSPPSSASYGEPLVSKGGEGGDSDSDMEDPSSSRDKPVKYVYSFFHIIFALASMYSAMLLTGWGGVGEEGKDIIDVGWPSVWVKIVSQWLTALLYCWSLAAPVLFPDRDFS